MRILITGGNGFLGSAICNQITRTNHKVFVLDNTNKKNLKKNFIKGDITDLNLLKKKLKGIDVVFHLAGLSDLDTAYKNPIKTANLNILGTVNILEACRLNRVKKIIGGLYAKFRLFQKLSFWPFSNISVVVCGSRDSLKVN